MDYSDPSTSIAKRNKQSPRDQVRQSTEFTRGDITRMDIAADIDAGVNP